MSKCEKCGHETLAFPEARALEQTYDILKALVNVRYGMLTARGYLTTAANTPIFVLNLVNGAIAEIDRALSAHSPQGTIKEKP